MLTVENHNKKISKYLIFQILYICAENFHKKVAKNFCFSFFFFTCFGIVNPMCTRVLPR